MPTGSDFMSRSISDVHEVETRMEAKLHRKSINDIYFFICFMRVLEEPCVRNRGDQREEPELFEAVFETVKLVIITAADTVFHDRDDIHVAICVIDRECPKTSFRFEVRAQVQTMIKGKAKVVHSFVKVGDGCFPRFGCYIGVARVKNQVVLCHQGYPVAAHAGPGSVDTPFGVDVV